MNFKREWVNNRNVVGFAAECARSAVAFYDNDRKPSLIASIERAERYAGGAQIFYSVAVDIADASYSTAYEGDNAAAHAAARAVRAVLNPSNFGAPVYTATYVGMDDHEIRAAFARWVVRDLSGGRELSTELRQAAGAAVVAGDEDLARALVQGEAC